MKVKEIQELLDFISQSGLAEVNIETEQFKVAVKKYQDTNIATVTGIPTAAPVSVEPTQSATPVSATSPAIPSTTVPAATENDNLITIKSPMIGTFYRSQNPESPAFANIGDDVTSGQTVCIIEAMKLFNEIESEVSGRIVKVLVENATPVEYDQPLFLVEPK